MRIFHDLSSLHGQIRNPAVTVGSFDGVHAGHREILRELRRCAAAVGGESVVVTFDPHPRQVICPEDQSLSLLNSLEEKTLLLEEAGVDNLFVVRFTPEFSRLTSEEFARRYLLEGIGAKCIVMGYNHHFGRDRQGNRDYLEALRTQHDFTVCQLPKLDVSDRKVSSTVLRGLIAAGDLESARELLGEPYFFIARPGADGSLVYREPAKLFPPAGDYPVEVESGKHCFGAVLSIAPDRTLRFSASLPAGIDPDGKLIIRFH